MKRLLLFPALALIASLSFSGCVVYSDDYYDTTPAYSHSFSDDFNTDRYGWGFTDRANDASVYFSNGRLHYDYHPANNGTNMVAVSTGMSSAVTRFDLQTRIHSNNAMALVWGASSSEYGYSFFIDSRGYFAVFDEGNVSLPARAVVDWTRSGAVRDDWNDLELQANGSNWIGYINGVQVFQIPARTLYGSQIGYMVLANTNGDAEFIDLSW
ncbi:MAG: hypothetical protein JST27_11935 [Bacteroidetes bacterium]|nr:hypothetical protein [Bacteroidota bacterium]